MREKQSIRIPDDARKQALASIRPYFKSEMDQDLGDPVGRFQGIVSLQVVCPACGKSAEWREEPVTDCPRCEKPYPEWLREHSDRSLYLASVEKPRLLRVGQILSLVAGAGFLLSPAFGLVSRAAAVLAVIYSVVLISIGVGLLRDRTWTRPLMITWWCAVPLVSDVMHLDRWPTLIVFLGAVGLAYATSRYLYGRVNVAAYFENCRLREFARTARGLTP